MANPAWQSLDATPSCSNCGAKLCRGEESYCEVCLLQVGLAWTPALGNDPDSSRELRGFAAGHSPPNTPDQVATYRVVRLLGQGGMGAVYLAHQKEPIEREVAVKLIKPGMDTREVLSRFRYEQQALALLDHPNIARIFDAGTTADGRPYFAMEHIDGLPVTAYCDERRLSIRARLELMVQVCDAVRHAHQRGLLHRDLKPGNILVAERDGAPVPKVIDFGVAKAIQSAEPSQTGLGQFVGTPEYMSPEQADYLGAANVDTTADVYSLGVVIYELLCGELPFDHVRARTAGRPGLLSLRGDEEAKPMADRVALSGDHANQLAERRGTDPATLRRELQGDVNWVVLRALERTRERRYSSVAELLSDLQRSLNDEPVLAAPPSSWYRVGKWARRNRTKVLAASAVIAAFTGGGVAALWQARVATLAQHTAELRAREAELQRSRAERHEASSQAHLEDIRRLASSVLFDLDDQVRSLSGATPARQALVRLGIEYLQKAAPPDGRLAAAHFRIGELQGLDGLRDLAGARSSYWQSVSLAEERLRLEPGDSNARLQLALAYSRLAEIEWDWFRVSDLQQRSRTIIDALARDRRDDQNIQIALAEILLRLGAAKDVQRAIEVSEGLLKANGNAPRLLWLHGRALVKRGGRSLELREADWSTLFLPENGKRLSLAECTGQVEAGLRNLRRAVSAQPANAMYQLSVIEADRLLAQLLVLQNRVRAGLAQAEKALSALVLLAAADLENPSLQVELALTELEVGTLTQRLGQMSLADRHLQQATDRLREQSRRHRQNLDLQIHVAEALRTIGNNESLLSGRLGLAVKYHQEALALLQGLAARHPEYPEVAVRVVQQQWALASAARHGETPAVALAASRAALQQVQLLKGPTDGYLRVLGSEAQFQLAQSLAAAGHGEQAVRAVEAGVEAGQSLRLPGLDRRILEMRLAVARWHDRRSQYAALRDSARLALAGWERLAAAPGADLAAAKAFQESLSLAMVSVPPLEQLELSRQAVAAARRAVASEPGDLRRRFLEQEALLLLGRSLRNAGRYEEAHGAIRDAIAALDAVPVESVEAIDTRLSYFDAYLRSQRTLLESGGARAAAELCLRILPAVQSLARSEPGLQAAWTMLHRFYGQTADAHWNAGDLPRLVQYRELHLQTLRERPSWLTAQDWLDIGLMSTQLGWVTTRLQRGADARNWWKGALAAMERSIEVAGPPRRDIHTASHHERAHYWSAYVHEGLGQYPEALVQWQATLQTAEWMCGQDANLSLCGQIEERHRALLQRAQHRFGGAGAKPPQTALEWLQAGRAYRWVAADSFQIGSPREQRWAAAQEALRIARRLVSTEPAAEWRKELGSALLLNAEVALSQGRAGAGRGPDAASLSEAIRLASEAAATLQALIRSDSLPPWHTQRVQYAQLLEAQAREALRTASAD